MEEKATRSAADRPAAPGAGYALRPDATYPVQVGTQGTPALLVRLSPEDMTLLWPSQQELREGEILPVVFSHGTQRLLAVIAEVRLTRPDPDGTGRLVDLRFSDVSLDVARQVLRLAEEMLARGLARTAPTPPLQNEEFTDAARIHGVLEAMARCCCSGAVTGAARPAEVLAVAYSGSTRLLRLQPQEALDGLPTGVRLNGYNSMYQFTAAGTTFDGPDLLVPAPPRMSRVRHRQVRRIATLTRTSVTFRHPIWPQLAVERQLADLSRGGASFWTDRIEDVLYPGLTIPEMTIARWGQPGIRVKAVVRSIAKAPGEGQARCGMQVFPASQEDEERWFSFVDDQLYPTTRIGGDRADSLWTLYEGSKTFHTDGIPPTWLAALRGAFTVTCKNLDAARGLGCHVVWPLPDRSLRAAQMVLKLYHGAWLGSPVARVAATGGDGVPDNLVRLDIHLRAYEHAQRDRDLRWVIGLHRSGTTDGWKAQFDDTARLAAPGRSGLFRYQLVRISRSRAVVAETAGGAGPVVRPVRPDERTAVARSLGRIYPAALLDALDLVPERMDLARVQASWRRLNLNRDRAILATGRGGRIAALAILESVDDGLCLFPGLDVARLHAFEEGARALFPALVRSAAGWYRSKGKPSFLCLLEPDAQPGAPLALLCDEAGQDGAGPVQAAQPRPLSGDATLSVIDLGVADLTVLAADLLPDLLEHVWAERTEPAARA